MTGSTPPWKRRFPRRGADPESLDGSHGARDRKRGPSRPSDRTDATAAPGPAPLDQLPEGGEAAASAVRPASAARRRAAAIRSRAAQATRGGVHRTGSQARAALGHLTDRIIDIAPRIPVRDLATLRRQFPGLGPEELADKLVAGAVAGTATVGAGVGAAAMLPVPPAMPAELAAEITGVAAIELKLIAELHEVYGVRPRGRRTARTAAYLSAWSGERGIDVLKPSTLDTALGGQLKRRLRQQIMKRMLRDLPHLMPFLVGAAVGAAVNRRDTKKLAARVREDLRKIQVPWDQLSGLPALENPDEPLPLPKTDTDDGPRDDGPRER
ncbi:hypothetical protein [Streptomyces thermodiastaticus]|uniref:hypothetical protein n=1 Tax=Streptomyces thermodiastaticus TaxID=44061 RepID=UPI0016798C9E|nr:hypothetical protein [Streptomyces thermodiastaticus]MCE7550817.1 EcsC family protein [Streptomyces thermodiastaticus]GHF74571.1 hypothetical protein GCM10018787_24160 [Streptomyces thermodiastaticus]